MSKKRPPLNDVNNNPGLIHLGSIPGQSPVASFNIAGIENLIETKGFIGYHYRHALNPNKSKENGPADPGTQINYRGFRYYNPRPLYHVPRSYQLEDLLTAQAIFQPGSVLLNISGKYADIEIDKTNQTHIRNHDLLIFPSLTDMTQQTFEYNPTGPQKLQYKVKGVDLLWDSERDYNCDEDFVVTEDGLIKWLDCRRPDPGSVLSVVYYFTPIYIVKNKIHSLRVIPSNEAGHGALPREAVYAPQQFVAIPSTLVEETNLLAWSDLPPLPDYPVSKNTTGGSV
jgi:hypothetical protein